MAGEDFIVEACSRNAEIVKAKEDYAHIFIIIIKEIMIAKED